jgi:hypothetical protein
MVSGSAAGTPIQAVFKVPTSEVEDVVLFSVHNVMAKSPMRRCV